MKLKEIFWRTFYTQWNDRQVEREPGYTVLMPVPGDLPVFLKIALEVCATQAAEHRKEILVIPDTIPTGFSEWLQTWAEGFPGGTLKLVRLNRFEYEKNRWRPTPPINHWLQLVRGAEATRTNHALLHDADLFITEPNFMKAHYEACVERDLFCLGVSPIEDRWYGEEGFSHLTAAWELMFKLDWLMSFPPYKHVAHDDVLRGEKHRFDIMLWAQCHTPPERIAFQPSDDGFIHFEHVVSTYRYFQKSKGPFEDAHFRLLLVRLLIDAFDSSGWRYELPTLSELMEGIRDKTKPVTYLEPATRSNYAEFRNKISRLIESDLFVADRAAVLEEGARKFESRL